MEARNAVPGDYSEQKIEEMFSNLKKEDIYFEIVKGLQECEKELSQQIFIDNDLIKELRHDTEVCGQFRGAALAEYFTDVVEVHENRIAENIRQETKIFSVASGLFNDIFSVIENLKRRAELGEGGKESLVAHDQALWFSNYFVFEKFEKLMKNFSENRERLKECKAAIDKRLQEAIAERDDSASAIGSIAEPSVIDQGMFKKNHLPSSGGAGSHRRFSI